jgi:hypothetical protein
MVEAQKKNVIYVWNLGVNWLSLIDVDVRNHIKKSQILNSSNNRKNLKMVDAPKIYKKSLSKLAASYRF